MSKRRATLDAFDLEEAAGQTHNPVDLLATQQAGRAKSRIGKVAIQGYYEKEFRNKFKRLALDKDTTVEALLEEAILDLFKKYGA